MPDNKSKVKEDRRRVALRQGWERDYLQGQLVLMLVSLRKAGRALDLVAKHLVDIDTDLQRTSSRLRSGFPAATKGKRRGK